MSGPQDTALIALDWGTTSARAYRVGSDGAVQDRRSAPLGILHVRDGAFAAALGALLGDWTTIDAPRLACGMVGSRQGWVEAPYTDCPADLAALARAIARTPGGEIAIVGGLAWRDERGTPDVMRGEETQIAGLPDDALAQALVIQPGTHSKWTVVTGGAITAFASYMTGELYAVLRDHSILGRLMTQEAFESAAFARGVDAGLRALAGELAHALFAARTLPLFGDLTPGGAADYLSGLLIGSEIAHARAWAAARGATGETWLVGDAALCARYDVALSQAGVAARRGPADASARGLWRLARLAGMA
jgi:2-dehydro-3-deoxygalactonokinase